MSVAAYYFFREQHTVLGYKDSLSHLLIGRRIVVGQSTGFGQLGGIWLPLQHLLIMSLAWNDQLYQSGLAGSIFSMGSYVACVVLMYRVTWHVTGQRPAAWAAAAVVGFSTNLLYLQATPMGETLMYAGLMLAVLCVVRWIQTDSHGWLFLGAATCGLLVFARYEAWVFCAAMWVVVLYTCLHKRHRLLIGNEAGQAYVLMFGFYMTLAVAGWLLWNQLIFGDWMQWLTGTHGSKDQTGKLALSQVGNLRLSVETYAYAMKHTVPVPLLALGAAGLLAMAWRERLSPAFVALSATLAPGVFITYGLYSGSQPMRVAEVDGDLYNLRMAVVMLLPTALFVGYAVSCLPRSRRGGLGLVAAVLITAVGVQAVDTAHRDGSTIVTNLEAKQAYDSYAEQRDVGEFLRTQTTGRILVESIFNEWVVFPNQDRTIYEGSQAMWDSSLDGPGLTSNRIDVIVMRSTPGDVDQVYSRLYGSDAVRDYGVVLQTDNFLVLQRGEGDRSGLRK
ncbi:hypothetical protein BH09ACT12_BH09ACT12_17850 [soil metagenome]